jgi:hypothetical protein
VEDNDGDESDSGKHRRKALSRELSSLATAPRKVLSPEEVAARAAARKERAKELEQERAERAEEKQKRQEAKKRALW